MKYRLPFLVSMWQFSVQHYIFGISTHENINQLPSITVHVTSLTSKYFLLYNHKQDGSSCNCMTAVENFHYHLLPNIFSAQEAMFSAK